jgi:hypothetical protein
VHSPPWKAIHGDLFAFESDVSAHNEVIAVGHAPIHGIPGRISDSEVNETARIWVIVESAPHELLHVVRQLFGMVNDYRILSNEMGELKAERARLQGELRSEVRRESGV